jgi:hypothetical protein
LRSEKNFVSCTKKKPGLEPGFPVLLATGLATGDVVIAALIGPRSIVIVARVCVISIIRGGIAVTWAIAWTVVAVIVGAGCYGRT